MLAYVFWHWPAAGADLAGYERRLQAFQDALGDGVPARWFRLDRAPWADAAPGPVYEDWYLVEGWQALGDLNDRAGSGPRRAPHDAVARAAGQGAGAVYRLVRPGPPLADARGSSWLDKPRYEPYDAFLAGLGGAGGRAVWQRQLVLGPAPEFALVG